MDLQADLRDGYEAVVIGGGHAGCEAALACARLGVRTALVTQNLDTIAAMPCNCSIGGPGKAHLVREIDALGGEMARNIDRTYTHIRLLNSSRGPAVQALRAQADKSLYRASMKRVLETQEMLWLVQDTAVDISTQAGAVSAVVLRSGRSLPCLGVIVCTGTFLNGMIHMGEVAVPGGRAGEPAATELSDALRALGLSLRRYKTGTVPRVLCSTVDVQSSRIQPSETPDQRFSRDLVERPPFPLLACHATATNSRTHDLLLDNAHRSALWSGRIEGVGPRYCPSIEAKLQRFPERTAHTVFLEREGWETEEVYVQGVSSAMPADVQLAMLHTIPGLEHAHMVRAGYAIEYDAIDAALLRPDLSYSQINGLFFAGQVNGTSGYEEAAAQGLIAGINCARYLRGSEGVELGRHDGYVGVLIRDLTESHLDEPYRMLTSRAEFRLLFGQDAAWSRLAPISELVGLRCCQAPRVLSVRLHAPPARGDRWRARGARGSAAPPGGQLTAAAAAYFRRDRARLTAISRMGDLPIPPDLDFGRLPIRLEARERLAASFARTLREAGALPGVTPADLATLHAACAALLKHA